MAAATAERPRTELSVADQTVNVLSNGCFASMLPERYKDNAARWIQRGRLYINTSKNRDNLLKCSMASLVRAFLQGAEQGLPIDGKLAYLVPYGQEATFMASYIGLIAVARRQGLIVDGFARTVRERDEFSLSMTNGQFHTHFAPYVGAEPGEIVGAFAVLIFPGNRTVADFLSHDEIEAVRARSKAAKSGPWVSDWGEMAKKTVLRRTIKTYVDDADVLALLDADDAQHGLLDVEASEAGSTKNFGARRAAPLRLERQEPPKGNAREPEPEERTDPPAELTLPQQLDALFDGFTTRPLIEDRFNQLQSDPETPGTELQLIAAKDRALGRVKA